MILNHLDKNNLHHAYLIEGTRDEIVPEILEFFQNLGVETVGNPDFIQISIDNFKIEEAFSLRSMSADKSLTVALSAQGGKKIFIICANSFSLDAQNVLLKMFEEPIENTHFFLIVPDVNALLKTLVSRFYLISTKSELEEESKMAEKFIMSSLQKRIDFVKELIAEAEEKDEEGNEVVVLDAARSKALKFLNAVELTLSRGTLDTSVLEHIFKVREFLRMPGSSTKILMESVALVVPDFKDMQSR